MWRGDGLTNMEGKEEDANLRRDIGANIKRLRRERGWTQADLARESGLSIDTVRSYEGGRTSPSVVSLAALKRALRCSSDEIIGDALEKIYGSNK